MSISTVYIDHLQRQNAEDLAFYPLSTLEKAVEDNRVITCSDNDEPAGYIWHGPLMPSKDTVIYQACVDYDSRRRHLGWGMVKDLIELGISGGISGIRLRCSSSSESNEFWKLIGFYCTKVSECGVKRKRQINHWRTDIYPALFKLDEVLPSSRPVNLKTYQESKRKNETMPNRWSRAHY